MKLSELREVTTVIDTPKCCYCGNILKESDKHLSYFSIHSGLIDLNGYPVIFHEKCLLLREKRDLEVGIKIKEKQLQTVNSKINKLK